MKSPPHVRTAGAVRTHRQPRGRARRRPIPTRTSSGIPTAREALQHRRRPDRPRPTTAATARPGLIQDRQLSLVPGLSDASTTRSREDRLSVHAGRLVPPCSASTSQNNTYNRPPERRGHGGRRRADGEHRSTSGLGTTAGLLGDVTVRARTRARSTSATFSGPQARTVTLEPRGDLRPDGPPTARRHGACRREDLLRLTSTRRSSTCHRVRRSTPSNVRAIGAPHEARSHGDKKRRRTSAVVSGALLPTCKAR